jgi:hypothetical protein
MLASKPYFHNKKDMERIIIAGYKPIPGKEFSPVDLTE